MRLPSDIESYVTSVIFGDLNNRESSSELNIVNNNDNNSQNQIHKEDNKESLFNSISTSSNAMKDSLFSGGTSMSKRCIELWSDQNSDRESESVQLCNKPVGQLDIENKQVTNHWYLIAFIYF
jgi:hypothetical protein